MNTPQLSNADPCRNISIIIILVMIFTGCATLKKDECLTADWYQIGFEDGIKGYPVSRISKHRKACSKYEVTPDLQVYLDGRNKGLKEYCTPHNGYLLGVRGHLYQNQCQSQSDSGFLEAYNRGKDVYNFKRRLKNEEAIVKRFKKKWVELNDELSSKEGELSKNCLNQQDCKYALDEIRFLEDEMNALDHDIWQKENQIQGMREALADMENQNRDY